MEASQLRRVNEANNCMLFLALGLTLLKIQSQDLSGGDYVNLLKSLDVETHFWSALN